MVPIWDAGVSLIQWMQQATWPALPMKFFSFLGSENFFLLILPMLYWCIDTGIGLRVGLILSISSITNAALKLAMRGPRPYWYSPAIKAMASEATFGVPSGHAQIAVGVWGSMATSIRRRWGWIAAVSIITLIGISRLYLGVHFPHDVLLGWTLGALTLWLFNILWEPASKWAAGRSLPQQIGLAFGASLLLLSLSVLAFGSLQGWEIPTAWLANVQASAEPELPDPVSLDNSLTSAGVLFGMLSGYAWLRTQGGFRADGPIRQRVARYLIGLVGVVILWYGLGAIFPRGAALLPYILRYLRYFILGLWVAAGAPTLFIRMRLGSKDIK